MLETHLSYDVRPRLWVSLDANFWRGGRTSLNESKGSETSDILGESVRLASAQSAAAR